MVLFGPDVSHYQSGIDLKRAASEGCSFVIGKISQGASSHDAQWPATRDQGRAAGLLICGYHFLTTDSPAAQAANCAAHIGDKSIPVALDWESGGGNGANLLAVLAAFRTAGLNVRLIYTGSWYFGPNGAPDLTGTGCALWKSRYPSTNPGAPAALYGKVPASYWGGLGGLATSLLQFTDAASVAGVSCDCSAFQGTRDQLAALLGVGAPTPPEGDDDMFTDTDRTNLAQALSILDGVWSQLAGDGAAPGQYTGWQSFDGGSGKALTLVDYARQADVQLNGIRAGESGTSPAPGLSDADKDDIAERVAAKLAARLDQ